MPWAQRHGAGGGRSQARSTELGNDLQRCVRPLHLRRALPEESGLRHNYFLWILWWGHVRRQHLRRILLLVLPPRSAVAAVTATLAAAAVAAALPSGCSATTATTASAAPIAPTALAASPIAAAAVAAASVAPAPVAAAALAAAASALRLYARLPLRGRLRQLGPWV